MVAPAYPKRYTVEDLDMLPDDGTLDGGDVLPGFSADVLGVFSLLDE